MHMDSNRRTRRLPDLPKIDAEVRLTAAIVKYQLAVRIRCIPPLAECNIGEAMRNRARRTIGRVQTQYNHSQSQCHELQNPIIHIWITV